MKIGCIFECGKDGPDIQVCRYLVDKLNSVYNNLNLNIEFKSISIGNKTNKDILFENCGPAAKKMLEIDRCEKVIILWDLYPNHKEEKPCRRQDREKILDKLNAQGVDLNRVSLVCICQEFEAWLLADHRAVENMIAELKHPHSVGKIPKCKKPDSVNKPKTRLTKIFNQELGKHRRYIDYQDAIKIAQNITDFNKIKNSESFRRFALKVTGITL